MSCLLLLESKLPVSPCPRSPLRQGTAAALAMCCLSASSFAAEYCVTCAGPAAMYACSIEGSVPGAAADPRQQLYCIQQLAALGGHDSCSVPRSAPTPCPGVVRVVAMPEASTLPLASEGTLSPSDAALAPPPAGGAPASVAPADKAQEPRTVEELATKTLETSKKGLEKAGDAVTGTAEKAGQSVEKAGSAVGTAAKKTWDCLKSLFSNC